MLNKDNLTDQEIRVLELLHEVIDPELLLNIVDLGLVYGVAVKKESKAVEITLTLTTTGCPLGDVIIEHARQVVMQEFIGYEVHVHLVWEPKWTSDLISPTGKQMLGKS